MRIRPGTAIVAAMAALCALLCALTTTPPAIASDVDRGVIRLPKSDAPAEPESPITPGPAGAGNERRAFDAEAFDSRFESLWFQRKAYQAAGRDDDVARQAELIRDFVTEEGVRRMESPAGALVMEARGRLREGSYDKALAALALAESLDPGRPQIAMARAHVLWTSRAGPLAAGAEYLRAIRGLATASLRDLNALNASALILVAALAAGIALFSLLMVVRYQVALRHDVEEWLIQRDRATFAKAGGWAFLLAPLILWVGAGWIAIYWIVIVFRHMRRGERLLAASLLVATALVVPMYRFSVGLYGLAADPTVRTTIAAANGGYDPDRIVKLLELVDSHPDDPTYRFLLAGLYKNGRYFEDAFREYKKVIEAEPSNYQATINLGNIYFVLGQYGEAISHYRKAIELRPDCVLAYYNMYLAQSDTFKLKEAAESLAKARDLDALQTTTLLSSGSRDGGGAKVVDAAIDLGSIWRATVEGRQLKEWFAAGPEQPRFAFAFSSLANATSVLAIVGLLSCATLLVMFAGRPPAKRCARCGQPFCQHCKSGRDGHPYCSQCVHLFVLGDGLAPETKTMKLYEVERHETNSRRWRRAAAVILPGASHLLTGRAWIGFGLLTLWLVAWIGGFPASLAPLESSLGLTLRLSALHPGSVPDVYGLDMVVLLAIPLGLFAWLAGNLRSPQREA